MAVQLDPSPPPFTQGVMRDCAEMLRFEFRMQEALSWSIGAVVWLSGSLVGAIGGLFERENALTPQELPKLSGVEEPTFDEVREPYEEMFTETIETWLKAAKGVTPVEGRGFAQLLGREAAAQLDGLPPELLGYFWESGGAKVVQEQLEPVGEALARRLDSERIARLRARLLERLMGTLGRLFAAVREIDSELKGDQEQELLKRLGMEDVPHQFRLAHRVEEIFAKLLASSDPIDQARAKLIAPLAGEVAAHVVAEGIEQMLGDEALGDLFYGLIEMVKNGFPKIDAPANLTGEREQKLIIDALKSFFRHGCKADRGAVFTTLFEKKVIGFIHWYLEQVLQPDGDGGQKLLLFSPSRSEKGASHVREVKEFLSPSKRLENKWWKVAQAMGSFRDGVSWLHQVTHTYRAPFRILLYQLVEDALQELA